MNEYRDERLAHALSELPAPSTSDDFFARLRAQIAHPRARAHRLPSRRLVATAAAVGLALVVGGVAGALLANPSSGATPPVPVFQPTLGWNTFESNVGDFPLPVAFAANVPFQTPDTSRPGIPPAATLKSLPSNGIVIAVGGPSPYAGDQTPPQLQFPLRLSQLYFASDNYEGQPAPNVSQYQISGRVNSTQTIEVFVWMGTNHPTQDMINAANKELDQLQMPS